MPRRLLRRQVGVAFADAAGRRLGACEFADDENFCNLEAVTTQLGAKECVMPKVRSQHSRVLLCIRHAGLEQEPVHLLTGSNVADTARS